MFLQIIIPVLVLLVLAFAAIGIKMFVKKNGRFERHCANADNPDVGCVCGGKGGEHCKNKGNCPNANKKSVDK